MSQESEFIRSMRPGDLETIRQIYLLAHVDEYADEDTDFAPEGITDNPALLQLFSLSKIFVYDDGEMKGFVGNRRDRIIWLYVHPDHRGQKIGSQLIDFMLKRLEGRAAISVVKSNELALSFYRRRDFLTVGEFSFDYQGVPVEVLSLQLTPDGSKEKSA